VGVDTVIVDDPLLTVRGAFRERSLMRVVFDRSLRTPPGARLFSTLSDGPVVVVTTARGADNGHARRRLEEEGATIEVAADHTLRAALERVAAREVNSLLLEGGATVHCSALTEDVVDFVRLYLTPHVLGANGVKLANGFPLSIETLARRRIEVLDPDRLIEGYVHGPH
jgi:diaminohydroxyphosphoribosylaminopyrimidine deaminase/5-amino-6-(5-phosphoribosylamino)uracil reductase